MCNSFSKVRIRKRKEEFFGTSAGSFQRSQGRRVGVSAFRRVGVSAFRRFGVSAKPRCGECHEEARQNSPGL
jgi:hypothetical protein